MTDTLNLTPNYQAIFKHYLQQAVAVDAEVIRTTGGEPLSLFRDFIVSLNLAVQCCTTAENLLEMRNELLQLVQEVTEEGRTRK